MSSSLRPRSVLAAVVLAAGALTAGTVAASTVPPIEEPRLVPASPEALGAPTVPAPTESDGDDPADFATALAPYDDFGTDAAVGEFPRTIRHAMGVTEIAAAPERVVVLDLGELDSMVQLGIRPVGAVEYNDYGLPPYILDQVRDTELVGTVQELNLEAIAALDPDLIVSSRLRHEDLYDQLSAIAPTVFSQRPGVAFKLNFRLYAQAVGREAEGVEVVARYEDAVRAANAALPDDRPTVSIVQLRADGVRFYLRANFLGVVLTDVGLPRSESENVDDFAFDLSTEQLPDYADGELLIASVAGGDENSWAADVLAGPIWSGLPAVQAGDVLEVDSRTWIGGVGYGAAIEVLDELTSYFSPTAGSAAGTTGPSAIFGECTEPASDDYPRTVEHGLGSAEFETRPERVVTLAHDGDFTAALGVIPVAASVFPFTEDGFSPWFTQHLGNEITEIGRIPAVDGQALETIAAADPDVILSATYWGIAEAYSDLTGLGVPVLGYRTGIGADTWQDQTTLIAAALGLDDRAACVIDAVDSEIAARTDEHQNWDGVSIAWAYYYAPGTIRVITSPDDNSIMFLEQLGFELGDGPTSLPFDAAIGGTDISLEQLNALDADFVLMAYATPELRTDLESNALFTGLDAVVDGRYVAVGQELAIAMREPTPLSIPYALDELEPELARAIG